MGGLKNWAGNIEYSTDRVERPNTVDEAREIVANASKVRPLGSRHSFNRIADTTETLLSTERLNRVVEINPEARTVTAEGGIRYGELGVALHEAGWGLHNLASLPHISVAGAVATATHGSGETLGNLASAVRGVELILPDGSLLSLVKGRDAEFEGAVVNLGALGVVARITLAIEPTYDVRQDVYLGVPFETAVNEFDAIQQAATSVSLFTSWGGDTVDQLWLKNRDLSQPPQMQFGAKLADRKMHPILDVPAENCTEQGYAGPWHERMAHFRLDFTPSNGDELQSEYLLPRRNVQEALRAVATLGPRISPLLHISEVRTMAADGLWLSPACDESTVGIHFTWKPMWPEVQLILPEIEALLLPLGALPHWGKLFAAKTTTFRDGYRHLQGFWTLANRLDPSGKFRNSFTDELLEA